MFKLSTSTLSALAAFGLAVAAAAPSFAWGVVWPGSATQVANRDVLLQQQIINNTGHLRGQEANLASREMAIRVQLQRDLAINGGFLTYTQQRQLNAQEDNLQRQINTNNFR